MAGSQSSPRRLLGLTPRSSRPVTTVDAESSWITATTHPSSQGHSGRRQRRPVSLIAAKFPAVPSQTFSQSSWTPAPIHQVWATLDRPETWQAIAGIDRVLDPDIDDEGRLQGFSFETVAGGKRHRGTASPHLRIEGTTMAWNVESSEVRGITTVDLETEGSGTRVHVTVQVESVGLLSSMFFPVIASALGNGLPAAVDEFVSGLSRPA